MKIISYNVNGIRAALRKGLTEWLRVANPDIFCVQETKAQPEQVDISEIQALGYTAYWHSAQRKGYSGVAIFSKIQPKNVEIGTGIDYIDHEGRVIRLDFDQFSVISLYLPSGTNMEERLDFKLQFCEDFLNYIRNLKQNIPNLVIAGDYNICHEAIDIHDPIRNAKVSGFLPVERDWMTRFIDQCEMIDSYRFFVKEPHHYTWWSYRANARANNKGWRIDYHMVSHQLKNLSLIHI